MGEREDQDLDLATKEGVSLLYTYKQSLAHTCILSKKIHGKKQVEYKSIEGYLLFIPEQVNRFTYYQVVLRNIKEVTSASLRLLVTIKP